MIMVDKHGIGLLVCGILFCFLFSCGKYGRSVDKALSFSGENRPELELVLKHYQDSTLKLKAAEFLIANMPGLSVVDTASLAAHRSFYQTCDSVRALYKATQRGRWALLIDSLWDVYKADNIAGGVNYIPLLKAVTAEQLIQNIDIAFESWKSNAFTMDCSFEDFCEYILPMYRGNGFVIDDARLHFYQLYKEQFYKSNKKSVLEEVDYVLSFYKNITYDTFYNSNIPILSTEALMQIGGSNCMEKAVFNSVLLSALGIPIAIDFVPMWGNKGDSHSWNVLVIKGKHYAFDPFWNEDNWVYNRLYSNTGVYDPSGYGELRVAKIYRKTYFTHLESTLLDKDIPMDDIPPLFRNFKIRDVSADYFEAADIEVELTERPPLGAKYAYLSVFTPDNWVVVQFGKIIDGKAVFKGMGKNIVYQPSYYEKGNVKMAAPPFLLTKEGGVRSFASVGKADETVVISGVEPDFHWNRSYLSFMMGTSVIGSSSNGTNDTLCTIATSLPIYHTKYDIDSPSSYRFLRIALPSDSIALGDISFYSPEGKISNVKIVSDGLSVTKGNSPDLLFDEFKYTCYRNKVKERYVDIDLGKLYELKAIGFSPYLRPILYANSSYELFYWENGWKSLDKQVGGVDYLTFENVPRGALLRLKQSTQIDRKVKERLFMYKDGEVIWM